MSRPSINTIGDAIGFLRSSGQEVLASSGTWTVFARGPAGLEAGWSAESDAELIRGARLEQSILGCLPGSHAGGAA